VQNQPDFQAGSADHRTHFVSDVPKFVREAMKEYSEADRPRIRPDQDLLVRRRRNRAARHGLGHRRRARGRKYLRGQGKKVGVISIKLLQPFPEAEVVAALKGQEGRHVLERCDVTALTSLRHPGLFKGARTPRACAMKASRRSTNCPRSPPRSSASAPTTCSRAT
jgi:pyruvate-ferredoxin/flavodoxin oxidoreductase